MLDLFGLLVSFGLLVVLVQLGQKFGSAMLVASIVLALFSPNIGFSLDFFRVFWDGVTSLETVSLTVGIALIGILAHLMDSLGEIRSILEGIRDKLPEGGLVASIPAVFGLLPIPGGALLSAPLVDEEGEVFGIGSSMKTFLNLWFRHVGFLIFPLAPPLIFLSSTAGVPLYQIILIQVPIFFAMLGLGVLYLRRETKDSSINEEKIHSFDQKFSFLSSLSPVLVSIIILFVLSLSFGLPYSTSLVFAIPVGILTSLYVGNNLNTSAIKDIKDGFSFDLALAAFGIMIFYEVIVTSGVSDALSELFVDSSLPIVVIVVIISFILGFSMGHNLGAVGVSYSILETTIGSSLPLVSLIYIGSFFGYLISPVHLCVTLSYEYFDADLSDFYKVYILPSMIILVFSMVLFGILG